MGIDDRMMRTYHAKRHRVVLPQKLIILSLLVTGLMAGCVPEVVKYNKEGNVQFAAESYAEALDAYRLAEVSEPDQPEPYYNAANTYNRQGDVAGTALQTEQALKTSDPELQAQAWYNLGNAHFDGQQWQEAIESYKAALRLNPEDSDAKHNLELALQAAQQQEQEQEKESQDSENQENAGEGSSSDEQATPAPEEGSPEQGETENAEAQTESQEQQMTAEQAQQLLEALLGDSETLQEHLQQYFQTPGIAPEEDW